MAALLICSRLSVHLTIPINAQEQSLFVGGLQEEAAAALKVYTECIVR